MLSQSVLEQTVDFLYYLDSEEILNLSNNQDSDFQKYLVSKTLIPKELPKQYTALRYRKNGSELSTEFLIKLDDIFCNTETREYYTLKDDKLKLTGKLRPLESKLLGYLHENVGRAVSINELFNEVWGQKVICKTDLSNVRLHVYYLRNKVDPDKKHIRTVHGKGYLLDAVDFEDLFKFGEHFISKSLGLYFNADANDFTEKSAKGKLRPATLNLAICFYEKTGRLLPLNWIHHKMFSQGKNTESELSNVRVYVKFLRNAVDPEHEYISTIRGLGYIYDSLKK